MIDESPKNPSEESIHVAMKMAWNDHHHARDQTWKTVQIVAALGAALLTVDFQYENYLATLLAAILVIVASFFGAAITWNHRALERRKFIHLMNCEERLGLHRDDLLPLRRSQKLVGREINEENAAYPIDNDLKTLIIDSEVSVPKIFRLIDIVDPRKHNTALFILRMHIAIMIFAALLAFLRIRAG